MDREIYAAIEEAHARGEPVVLATVVSTRGSTPRKAGAKMVIYPDGRIRGTIGGGCGENDVWLAAQQVARTGVPQLVRVDLTEEYAIEVGMVCGGVMDVLVEPLPPDDT
ncbi:MAG: XdhC family protein [Chloroflexi bacterium]|nr:XdhC family protein [Chloroflexota bacterium]GIW11727.1 MAG: sulfurylase small subunit, molybdopterin cytosine dinucleotide biosynthesis [Dehalococcoidia bacterium]